MGGAPGREAYSASVTELSERVEQLDYALEREAMVELQLRRHGIQDARVLEAMAKVPRHLFVAPELRAAAYDDTPLPTAHGQTISQPRMVAIMLQRARLSGDERVLDVGAGSGYQAALLGYLAREVYAVEIWPDLAEGARRALTEAGIGNVEVITGDGSVGYPPAAPYDVILVGAAARDVPPALVEQLAENGRLLVPVGGSWGQRLVLIRKRQGLVTEDSFEGCSFVPLVSADRRRL